MKKFIICMVTACFLVVGCTGSFNLTRKVYDFHRSQENKWVDEVLFLGFCWIPVYGLAAFVDAVIMNSIEFWTGENPVDKMTKGNSQTQHVLSSGDSEIVMTYDQSNDSINLQSSNFPGSMMTLERSPSGVVAKDSNGNIVYASVKDEAGGVSIYNGDRKLVKYFSAAEVLAKQNLIQ